MHYLRAMITPVTKRMTFLKLIRSCTSGHFANKSANLIRKEFMDYFADLEHAVVRSSPVSPINDRSLAFVNAGMNQFKGIFLDYYEPPATKVTNSQKCVRVGGKHNDLSVVGNDSYHHTFFEMLGNWSFGDYFKEEACSYAWNLLTNVYSIPKEYLYVTYFGGNEELGLAPDLECRDIWLRLGLPESKILPFGMQDNFWEMGLSGPCGPCTEIHVDYIKRSSNQAARVNKGYDDLTELWNIVFIQYERLANGCIVPLSKHHVDTGMGLERLVTLLQGKRSNYDTDLFQPLFKAIQSYSKAPEYKGMYGNDDVAKIDYGYRILADHARMITVALADNMLPEQNPKLRRVLRSAIDVGEEIFRKSGIVAELARNVADNLGAAYPELHSNLKQVQRIITFEEDLLKRLRNTCGKTWKSMVKTRPELALVTEWMAPGLVDGYKYLQSTMKELRKTNALPGTVALNLYKTYGLSPETVAELAQIESLHFDETDFEKQLDNYRYRTRIGLDRYSNVLTKEFLRILKENNIPKTADSFKYNCTYDGNDYEFPTLNSKVVGVIFNGKLVTCKNYSDVTKLSDVVDRTSVSIDEMLNSVDDIGIILDKTICYSFEGGQVSDRGNIRIGNLHFSINSVRKVDGYVIHFGRFVKPDTPTSKLQLEDDCSVTVEPSVRVGAMRHHTAAHLLNAAVKQVMQAAYQRGCAVDADSLKLVFNSFGQQFTAREIGTIEDRINNVIRSHAAVTVQTLNSLELLKQDNVTLLPGEIYPYTGIRVIEINSGDLQAKEPCCGTHVHDTRVLQQFWILTCTSKGATRWTLKAVVGPKALRMKEASDTIWSKIVELEDMSRSGEITCGSFDAEVSRMKEGIRDENAEIPLPYTIKEKYLTHLDALSKAARIREKEIEKASIANEIANATDSSSSFIVHWLNKNPAYLSLHEIVSLFPETPVLILCGTDEFVRARCSVPQEVASNEFNAQIWMDIVLRIFNAKHGPIKGFKPMLVASMRAVESPQNFQILVEKALTEATKFASMRAKQIRLVNNENQ